MWKLVLRTLSIILAGVAIGLIAWAELHAVIPILQPANDPNGSSPGDPGDNSGTYEEYLGDPYIYAQDDYELPWEYISLGLSIIWNFTNIGVWFTPSRSGRGIHPGVKVGCDLILWMILLLTGSFASFAADNYISRYGEYQLGYFGEDTFNNGTTSSNGTDLIDPSQCSPFLNCDASSAYDSALKHKGVVIALGVAFTFIIMLLHFALFISACRYTHARRYEQAGRYAKATTEEATAIATKMVRDMGYPLPPGQWSVQGQAHGETTQGPSSSQPAEEMTPAERETQERYQMQMREAQQQQDATGKGKGKEKDLEQGNGLLGDIGAAAGESSAGHPNPDIRVETPGGGETGMIR